MRSAEPGKENAQLDMILLKDTHRLAIFRSRQPCFQPIVLHLRTGMQFCSRRAEHHCSSDMHCSGHSPSVPPAPTRPSQSRSLVALPPPHPQAPDWLPSASVPSSHSWPPARTCCAPAEHHHSQERCCRSRDSPCFMLAVLDEPTMRLKPWQDDTMDLDLHLPLKLRAESATYACLRITHSSLSCQAM